MHTRFTKNPAPRGAIVCGLTLLLLTTCWNTALGQAASPKPVSDVAEEAVTPIPAPKTEEDAAIIRKTIETRLAQLPEVDTGPDVDSSGLRWAEAVKAAKTSYETYLKQLDALVEMQRRSLLLQSDEEISKRNAQIEEYRARIAKLEEMSASLPAANREKIRAEVAAEYERINTQHDTKNQKQTQRATALAELPKRIQTASEELARAREALSRGLQESAAPPEGMDTATFERIRAVEREMLALAVSEANLRAEYLAAEKVVLELENAAAEAMLPVLQQYAQAAGDCRDRFDAVATRSESETIAYNLARASSPSDLAYWSYRDLIARTRSDFASKLDGIRNRFRESERQKLARTIDRHEGFYDRLRERLDRVDGAEKSEAYRLLEELLSDFTKRRQVIEDALYESKREKDQINASWDIASEKLLTAKETLTKAVEHLDAAQRTKYDALLAELAATHRPGLDETVTAVLSAENDLIGRLEAAEKDLAEFLDILAGYRDSLFWSFTLARGDHVVRAVRIGVRAALAPGFHDEVRETLRRVSQNLRAIPSAKLGLAGALSAMWLIVGVIVRSRLRRRADGHVAVVGQRLKEQGGTEVGFSDRLWIQGARILGALLPLGLPVAFLFVYSSIGDVLSGDVRMLAIRMLGLTLVLLVTRVLLAYLFQSSRPRFRVLPCSNVVAQYYRWWGGWLWLLTLVSAPPAIVLWTLRIGPEIADALWSVYGVLALLLLVGFARNRQTVVRVVGRSFAQLRPTLFSAIVRVYPLLMLTLVGLLGMQVAGYVTFVGYIVRNVLHTAVALAIALVLSDLIHDLATKYAGGAGPADDEDADTGRDIDHVFEEFEAREMGLLVRTAAVVASWAVWLSALVWVFSAWGMTRLAAKQILTFSLAQTEGGPVTVQRVIAAVLTIFVSVKLSRGVRAVLDQKVYPTYKGINRAAQATVNSLLHYSLVVIGLYVALQLVHLNIGALAVLLGGLGLGLGLGLQPLVVNFVSGLLIFAERHIKVGDLVEVDGELGEVAGISMRSTQIRSFDNIDRIIPNSQFMTSTVTNWTLRDTTIRGKIKLGVAYGTDTECVRDSLIEIANAEPLVHTDPPPAAWFVNFGDNSLDFVLACWFSSPGDRWVGMMNMRYAIDKRFNEEGIEIPFPQRTLSVHPDAELAVRIVQSQDDPPAEPTE